MAYSSTPGGQFVNVLPDANEDPNIPLDLSNLAKAIEKRVVGVYASTAARDSALTAMGGQAGMVALTTDTTPYKMWYYNGSSWVQYPAVQPAITSGTANPTGGNDGDIYFKV